MIFKLTKCYEFRLMNLQPSGSSNWWTFGLLGFRTNEPSDYWSFGLMNNRTTGLWPISQPNGTHLSKHYFLLINIHYKQKFEELILRRKALDKSILQSLEPSIDTVLFLLLDWIKNRKRIINLGQYYCRHYY